MALPEAGVPFSSAGSKRIVTATHCAAEEGFRRARRTCRTGDPAGGAHRNGDLGFSRHLAFTAMHAIAVVGRVARWAQRPGRTGLLRE